MSTNMMSELAQALTEVKAAKEKYLRVKRAATPKPVEDYRFARHDGGTATLSDLFGDKTDLIVIHNMGRSCPYCTVWADGFNGLVQHFEDRTGLVLVNKDPVEVQKEFKASRGWQFNMVSSENSTFNRDMGFEMENGSQYPGYSTYQKRPDGTIVRIGFDFFDPGDDYCSLWNMFDMLADGVNGWEPKYQY